MRLKRVRLANHHVAEVKIHGDQLVITHKDEDA